MTWCLTVISIVGNWFNCRKKATGYIIWIICNTGWMIFDLHEKVYSRFFLDIVQTAMCIYGLKKWKEGPKSEEL